MSNEAMPFDDLSKTGSTAEDAARTQATTPRPELLTRGIKELDGFTFAFASARASEGTQSVHDGVRVSNQITFTEGPKEFHVSHSRDEHGNMVTSILVITEKTMAGEELQFHATLYALVGERLYKAMDKTYRGTPRRLPSFEESVQFAIAGKYREMSFRTIEEK